MNLKNIALCLIAGTGLNLMNASAYNRPQVYPLNQWQFAQAGDTIWRKATVPGTIHQDLIDQKELPNPFYGMNEQAVQWVENKDWTYRTRFTVTARQLQRNTLLEFDGLDTYADVYLNGALLLKADNMFVGYKIPVTNLREGENNLYVRFRSPITETIPQWDSDGFNYPADNDHADKRLSVYTRKAPYSYGWDWGIRLATCGIWRPARLVFYDAARIDDYYVHQEAVSEKEAVVDNRIEIYHAQAKPVSATLLISCRYKGNLVKEERKEISLRPGMNQVSVKQTIEKPHLWWPNGWGEAALYTYSASLQIEGAEVASQTRQVGLRNLRVVMEDDQDGKCFYFEVNGYPMFAKGANYIPDDALLPNIGTERYKRIFEDVKAAHMNMLRVWGGGIYEDDRFYEEADRNGILVWQDFLFACTTYPHDSTFLKRVTQEAEYNIKRLRGHASLAMWCGNNEIYEGMRYWGWQKKYTPAVYAEMQKGYDVLFRQLLPAVVKKLDPDRFYMHSSPYEANWGRPESWRTADSHNWGIWYGRKPFESLDTEIPRFMSEYGFQAFPEMKTIRTFAEAEDFQLESPVMNAHQKATIGNALIKQTMALYQKVPARFEDLVYAGLVLQGHGIRHGIEAHRRNRPYCMGSLVWQLNDSWPVVSWSGIDYYGNWKAMHYQMQRAFAPLAINAYREGDTLYYYLFSDLLQDASVKLELELMDFDGKVHSRQEINCHVPANTSRQVYKQTVAEALQGKDASASMIRITARNAKRETVAESIYYFAYPKDQKLPAARISIRSKWLKSGQLELTLKTDRLARDVFVEIPLQGVRFSDNFFDLLPGQSKRIVLTSPTGKFPADSPIRIHHLQETGTD